MKILIDNGHGADTAGKRSPDGKLREWKYTREIAVRVVDLLKAHGIDAEQLVPEERDIALSERCNRVNDWCYELGCDNVLLISIHLNAAGNGADWAKGRGWEAYTYVGQSESDKVAEHLYACAEEALSGMKIRRDWTDGDSDKETRYYILKYTKCAAVLTENLFMDNREDYQFLLSEEGRSAIVHLHVAGIIDYLRAKKKSSQNR